MGQTTFTERTEWLIDVAEGPISRVVIWRSSLQEAYSDLPIGSNGINYLVPDSRIAPEFPNAEVRSVGTRKFPVFGAVVGVRWEGRDWSSTAMARPLLAEIVDVLSQDELVKCALAKGKRDLTIRVDADRGCWVLTEDLVGDLEMGGRLAPSRLRWDCYQAIARHLLATPLEDESAALRERQRTEDGCTALHDLGVEAHVSQAPASEDEDDRRGARIEIAEGPISWVEYPINWHLNMYCCVSDPRIGPNSPRASIRSVYVRTFPLFGRVKEIRWRPWYGGYLSRWPKELMDVEFSSLLSDVLSKEKALTEKVGLNYALDHVVETDPDRRCWGIFQLDPYEEWTPELWDCFQAIAQSLLTLPMPTGEEA